MDMENNKPEETVPAPGTGAPHPSGLDPSAIKNIEASPSTGGLGAGRPVPAAVPAPVANTPEAAAAPAMTPAPAPVAAAKAVIPKTDGKTPGGWNRFAGYSRNDAKKKQNDRREGFRGRR